MKSLKEQITESLFSRDFKKDHKGYIFKPFLFKGKYIRPNNFDDIVSYEFYSKNNIYDPIRLYCNINNNKINFSVIDEHGNNLYNKDVNLKNNLSIEQISKIHIDEINKVVKDPKFLKLID